MKLNLYCVFISLLICCSRPMEAQQYKNLKLSIDADSIKSFAKKEQKVVAIRISKDTLCIVSTNKVLYYPFGSYSNFADYYSKALQNSEYEYAIDSAFNLFIIFKVHSENSELEFIENSETNKLELLNGHISDDSFCLFNGIKVGMKRTDLLLKFFTHTPIEIMDKPVIELKSGVDGVWYYFNFSNETLNKIDIETDYILSK